MTIPGQQVHTGDMGTALPRTTTTLLDAFARGEMARKRSQYIIAESKRLQRQAQALRAAAVVHSFRIDALIELRIRRRAGVATPAANPSGPAGAPAAPREPLRLGALAVRRTQSAAYGSDPRAGERGLDLHQYAGSQAGAQSRAVRYRQDTLG